MVIFFGKGLWLSFRLFWEICFNTSVTGYQEILTDPSYFKQIINFTFPHIGIVGTNSEDYESSKFLHLLVLLITTLLNPLITDLKKVSKNGY